MQNIGLISSSLIFLVLSFIIILLAQVIYYLIVPYNPRDQIKNNNLAVGVSVAGYFIAIVAIIAGASIGSAGDFIKDLVDFGYYSVLGIVLLNISKFINDKLILPKFCITKEIVEDKNVGTAAVVFGSFLASGLIIGGSISGQGGGIISAIAFFALGQLALILFSKIYNLLLPCCIHDEIEKDNVAVGVAFGGTLIALSIILLKGVSGDFTKWVADLSNFGIEVLAGIILLPTARVMFDKILIPKIKLNDALKQGNITVGVLEAVTVISIAIVYLFIVDFSVIG